MAPGLKVLSLHRHSIFPDRPQRANACGFFHARAVSGRPCRCAHQRSRRRENRSARWCCEHGVDPRNNAKEALTPPVRRLQMHDHPRPHGFGGLAPNGKTDATSHATRDNRPEFIAIEPISVDVGTRHGSAANFVGHARLPPLADIRLAHPLSHWVTVTTRATTRSRKLQM